MHRVDVVKYQPIITLYIFFAIAYMLYVTLLVGFWVCDMCEWVFFFTSKQLFMCAFWDENGKIAHTWISYNVCYSSYSCCQSAISLVLLFVHIKITFMSRQKFQNDKKWILYAKWIRNQNHRLEEEQLK